MKKIYITIVVVLLCNLSFAQLANGKYIIKLAANMKAVDAGRSQMNTNGGRVQLWDACADYKVNCEPQVWEITRISPTTTPLFICRIKLLHTDKYLTINSSIESVANGTKVILNDFYPPSTTNSDYLKQDWLIEEITPNKYLIRKYNSGVYLDADRAQMNTNGVGLQVWQGCSNTNANCEPQIFTFYKLPDNVADYFETKINYNLWKTVLNASVSGSYIHINNYTPQKNQYRSQEDSQYYKPNDIKMRIGRMGNLDSFTLSVLRLNPYSIYFQDINANRYNIDAANRKVLIKVNFESNGTEIFANCIKNIICTGDPSFHVDNLEFNLEIEPFAIDGRIRYRNAKATLSANFSHEGFNAIYGVLAPLANELRGPIFDKFSQEVTKYFNDSKVMTDITDRIYQGIVDQAASFGIHNTNPYFTAFYIDADKNLKFGIRK